MNQYAHYLESIIFAIEQGNGELAASHMQSLVSMLGGQKQISDMSAPAAMSYVLALYLVRSES